MNNDLLDKIKESFGMLVFGLGSAFVLSFIVVLPVWLLWNWICPLIWGWIELSLMQAWGLTLLCALLFKTGGSKAKSK